MNNFQPAIFVSFCCQKEKSPSGQDKLFLKILRQAQNDKYYDVVKKTIRPEQFYKVLILIVL